MAATQAPTGSKSAADRQAETGGLPGQVASNIYMDYNGSTPVDPAVRGVMMEVMA